MRRRHRRAATRSPVCAIAKVDLLKEIRQDPLAWWCPTFGCETVCRMVEGSPATQKLQCATCQFEFCGACGLAYHGRRSWKSAARKAAQKGKKDIGKRATKEKKQSLKSMKHTGFTKRSEERR